MLPGFEASEEAGPELEAGAVLLEDGCPDGETACDETVEEY